MIDENLLFGQEQSIATPNIMIDNKINDYFDKETNSFSGSFSSKGSYALNRNWLENDGAFKTNKLSAYSYVNILLDVRLKQNFKTFLNLQANSDSSTSTVSGNLSYSIKELFMDMNINRNIYFRAGKQVLQWSRTYFWNPSDVINTQKRNFFNLSEYREGTYGIKAHFPQGAGVNYYTFVELNNANNIDEIGFAGKAEYLMGNNELAFSIWKKKGYYPIIASDFSSKILGIDVLGELALSYGENTPRVKIENGSPVVYKISNKWVPKLALTLSKTYNWIYPDQISITWENFYNNSGYSENIFADSSLLYTMLTNNLYEPNYYAKYYSALFLSISKFPITDSSLNINTLANLVDGTGILSTGIAYAPVNNFVLGSTIYCFFGPTLGEYTYSGNRISIEFTSTMSF